MNFICEKHRILADPAAIAEANHKIVSGYIFLAPVPGLEFVGSWQAASGSETSRPPVVDHFIQPQEGLVWHQPVWKKAPDTSYHAIINEANENGTEFKCWSDCFRISAAVLGSETKPEKSFFDSNPSHLLPEKLVLLQQDGPDHLLSSSESEHANNLAQKFAFVLLSALKEPLLQLSSALDTRRSLATTRIVKSSESFAATKSNRGDLTSILSQRKSQLKPTKTLVREGGCVDGKLEDIHANDPLSESIKENGHLLSEFQELWETYSNVYESKEMSDLAKEKGINEYLRPKVGDTLIIVPAIPSKRWARWVVKDGYNPNFHWAPVVLVTDDGYVCLENFAVADPFEINHKWEFRYYKYDDGGYHSSLTKMGGYGNIALSFVVRMQDSNLAQKKD